MMIQAPFRFQNGSRFFVSRGRAVRIFSSKWRHVAVFCAALIMQSLPTYTYGARCWKSKRTKKNKNTIVNRTFCVTNQTRPKPKTFESAHSGRGVLNIPTLWIYRFGVPTRIATETSTILYTQFCHLRDNRVVCADPENAYRSHWLVFDSDTLKKKTHVKRDATARTAP